MVISALDVELRVTGGVDVDVRVILEVTVLEIVAERVDVPEDDRLGVDVSRLEAVFVRASVPRLVFV